MANELFVDTSAWYPVAVRDHADHERVAVALTDGIRGGARVVTTNLVIAETHALLLRRVGRATALTFVREIRHDPMVIVDSDRDIERDAVEEWLVRLEDQAFSYCDAVSFTVMRARGISDALALDRHFTTAGFNRLPRDS